MDLMLSAEQEAVRDAIRQVLRDRMPSERVRTVMSAEPGVDLGFLRAAGDLGWFGLALPEAAGGAGYGLPEAMLLFVELGRTLAPGPWLGGVLAAQALAQAGAPHTDALARILAGTDLVGLVDDPADRFLAGEAVGGVIDGGITQALLVVGSRDVRWVPRDATGVSVDVELSIDPTRRLAVVRGGAGAGQVLGAAAPALRRIGTVLAAAEAVGVAERTLEMSVEFAKVREQFGKPIGTFQAIKHRCADMATRTEVARAVVVYAAVAVAEGEPDAAFHVHSAKALATDAAIQNASDNVQNHGGMGYTWESDAHLHLKRARVLEHVFGSRMTHLDALSAPWRAAS
jgi:alkylation response protein AidB-like acyl-CoA dehydrogenase